MKTKTTRLKTPIQNNLTDADAELLAGELATVMILERKALAALDAEIKTVQAKHAPRLEAYRADLAARFPRLQAWAEANRATHFTKKKSIDYIHSEIGFRIGKPWISLLPGWSAKKTIAAMKVHTILKHYIRTKDEIDRQSILAKRRLLEGGALESVGIRTGQTETFYLDPKATEPESAQAVTTEPRALASAPSQKAA